MQLQIDEVESPIGTILLVAGAGALCALDFANCRERMLSLLGARYGRTRLEPATDPGGYTTRLRAYLDGDLDAVADIPVETGGTAFQRRVWSSLRQVPRGSTTTYGALAGALGAPTAARAVGLANSRNPVAIVIPCHRVVGANGSLTGYAGGIDRKRWLLAHEGAGLGTDLFSPRRRPASQRSAWGENKSVPRFTTAVSPRR